MLLDLVAFSYDNCSNKKVNNIFEKAVSLRKKLKRVLVIDINCQCETKCILISVTFHRQELNEYHIFSDFQVFTVTNSQVIEAAWQNIAQKNKITMKKSKNNVIRAC